MKRATEKLCSSAGETLIETLSAIVLVALATLLLVVSLRAAASINYDVREKDAAFREELSAAELGGGEPVEGSIVIKGYGSTVTKEALEAAVPPAFSTRDTAEVNIFSLAGQEGALRSYAASPEAEGGGGA